MKFVKVLEGEHKGKTAKVIDEGIKRMTIDVITPGSPFIQQIRVQKTQVEVIK